MFFHVHVSQINEGGICVLPMEWDKILLELGAEFCTIFGQRKDIPMTSTLNINLQEDIVPYSTFRATLSVYMAQTKKTHRPILVTQNGKAAAVLMDVGDFEAMQERQAILQDIARGEQDVREGRVTSNDDVFRALKARFSE